MERRSLRLLVIGLATLLALLCLVWLLPLLLPFLVALFLAGVIDRPVRYLERKYRLSRSLSVWLVLLIVMLTGGTLVTILFANLFTEVEHLVQRLPEYTDEWRTTLEALLLQAESLFARLPPPLDALLPSSLDGLTQFLSHAATGFLSFLQRVPNLLLVILVTTLTTYFVSRDQRGLATFLLRFVPRKWHPHLFEVKRLVVDGLFGYVKAQAILLTITMGFATGAFLLFGVRYAWLLGILAGLLDLVPVLGPGVVFVPVVIHFFLAGSLAQALGLAALWIALITMRQLLEPRVIGAQVGLHPLSMILAIYLGVRLLGMNGLWLGPCVAIGLRAIFTVGTRALPTS